MITTSQTEQARAVLDRFTIELPSWGFANTERGSASSCRTPAPFIG